MAFAEQVSNRSKASFGASIDLTAESPNLIYGAALYDAIMLYARAATKVLAEGGDLHDARAVTAAVRNTEFEGVGGSIVSIDEQGDRIESYEVLSYVVGAEGYSYGPI